MSSLRQTGGSLLLVNVHVLQQGPLRDTIKALLREARAGTLPFRMLMTSEQPLEDLDLGVTILKIPPVRSTCRGAHVSAQKCPALQGQAAASAGPSRQCHAALTN